MSDSEQAASAAPQQSVVHTPGPWRVRHDPSSNDVGDCFVEADRPSGSVLRYGIEILGDDYGPQVEYPSEQRYADAKLIAAAPELYEALNAIWNSPHKQCRFPTEQGAPCGNCESCQYASITSDKVEAALSKARGA